MAFKAGACFLIVLMSGVCATKTGEGLKMQMNPIRKVVNLLTAMAKKVTAEGEKSQELFEKFACYCKNGEAALSKSIEDAEKKAPELVSEIEAAESQVKQYKSDLKEHEADRKAAKKAMAEATAVREKEAKAYADEKSEADADIAASGKAIVAIEKGMAGSFLQTAEGQRLQQMVLQQDGMSDYDREEITAFLSNKEGYAPSSGEIVGILKQMKETMEKSLAEITKAEEASIEAYEGLMAAKTKEVEALTKSIEEKMVRLGELKVSIVEMKEDLDDTGKGLIEDKKFIADLEKNCKEKAEEHEEAEKLRSQELVALADTIKVLNDDDALDLFKKTLPSASSFMQIQVSMKEQRRRALAALKHKGRPDLNFIALALAGKKVSFDKVVGMIDEMVAVLGKEQSDDDHKKEYCLKQFDEADDKKKGLEHDIKNLDTTIDEEKELIAALEDEIKALEESIVALDKAVAEATAQRKEEHEEYVDLMANDNAAKELLAFAKNRLNKFYNPKLYKPPPKREMSREDQITVSMGGTLAPTAAPGGIAGTGITVMAQISDHAREAPPPPPAAGIAYKKKSEDNNGVVAMIDLLIADLTKEMTEAETQEKIDQADYEKTMKESAEKRALDSETLANKEKAKSEAVESVNSHEEEKTATTKSLMATEKFILELHGECDWLLQYFEVRKEARAGEVESLTTAKAVLSGADYSLVEVAVRHRSLRGHK
jgi:septal ring factor EnvC (AmiA/AmiB activator)